MQKQRDVILLTQKTNDANFFVEKYAIARDAQPFEKVDRARDATLFWRRAPSSGKRFTNGWINIYR